MLTALGSQVRAKDQRSLRSTPLVRSGTEKRKSKGDSAGIEEIHSEVEM